MFIPFVVSSFFVLLVIVLCIKRPNAGRIFLGLFFLIMALGVNGSFTFGNPQGYVDYAGGALLPFYRELALFVVRINPFIFGLFLITYEIAMALLILHKGRSVKIGLIGTMLFILGITPLSIIQIPWLGFLIAEGYLLNKDFEFSLWELLTKKQPQNRTEHIEHPDK